MVIQDICLFCANITLDVRLTRDLEERGGMVRHWIRDDCGSYCFCHPKKCPLFPRSLTICISPLCLGTGLALWALQA